MAAMSMNRASARDYGFQVELAYPPLPPALSERDWHGFAHALSQRGLEYSRLSTERGALEIVRTFSESREATVYTFARERMYVRHEFVGELGFQPFCENALLAVTAAFEELRVPVMLDQRTTVRKLVSMAGREDARIFLMQRVSRIDSDTLDEFGRPVHTVGLRYFFPVVEDTPYEFDVRVESLMEDPHTLYFQNRGKFVVPPVEAASAAEVVRRLRLTREFIETNVFNFLDQFREKPKDEA
jgi:hypothetical protein